VKQADCEKFWQIDTLPPVPTMETKYDHTAILAFYNACKSYKKTADHFRISSKGTLHYILQNPKSKTADTAG
jgi:hypothetical protein